MSRTLGFIAGLTVPAGIYYYSVVNLNQTTSYLSHTLHQQSIRLANPTEPELVVVPPRPQEHLTSRIQQGWNEGIENGVRFIQETDWERAAKTTGSVVSALAKSAYSKMQPTIENGKEKLHEMSEHTRDGALHAGEAVGSALHKAGDKAHDVIEQGKLKTSDLLDDSRVKAAEAKEYLHGVEQKAAKEFSIFKSQVVDKSSQLKDEAAKQAHEAGNTVTSAASTISQKLQELKDSATGTIRDSKNSASRVLNRTEQKAHDALLSSKLRAGEEWILAEKRLLELTDSVERAASMKAKEAEQAIHSRRIGFASINDSTEAQRHYEAAQRFNMRKLEEAAANTNSQAVML